MPSDWRPLPGDRYVRPDARADRRASKADHQTGALGRHVQWSSEQVDRWPEWMKPAYVKGTRMNSSQTVFPLHPAWKLERDVIYVIGTRDGKPFKERFRDGDDLPPRDEGRLIKPFKNHVCRWLVEDRDLPWWWVCEADPLMRDMEQST
jgi:hypothetical protein